MPSAHSRLPIQTVERVGHKESVALQRTVHCPVRGRSVPVEHCQACERITEVHLDLNPRKSYVECAVPESQPVRNLLPPVVGPVPRVREVMTSAVTCLEANVSLEAATLVLVEKGISGVPVIDEAGKPIGMLSKSDLLFRQYEQLEDEEDDSLFEGRARRARVSATVGEVMTRRVFALGDDAPVTEAAALMAFEGVHRLPIVDADGRVIGIVSAIDVLGWLARESGYVVPKVIRKLR